MDSSYLSPLQTSRHSSPKMGWSAAAHPKPLHGFVDFVCKPQHECSRATTYNNIWVAWEKHASPKSERSLSIPKDALQPTSTFMNHQPQLPINLWISTFWTIINHYWPPLIIELIVAISSGTIMKQPSVHDQSISHCPSLIYQLSMAVIAGKNIINNRWPSLVHWYSLVPGSLTICKPLTINMPSFITKFTNH